MFLFKNPSPSPLLWFGVFLAVLCMGVLSRIALADDIDESPPAVESPSRDAFAGLRMGRDAVNVGASLCVAELGWRDRDMCTALIYATAFRARKHGRTFVTQARLYSAGLRGANTNRLWPAHLHLSSNPPRHWNEQTSAGTTWRGWGLPRYRNVTRHVRAVLRGEVENPCEGCEHYGNVADGPPTDDKPWIDACPGLATPNARGERQICWASPPMTI